MVDTIRYVKAWAKIQNKLALHFIDLEVWILFICLFCGIFFWLVVGVFF